MTAKIKIPSMGESITEVVIGQIFTPTGTLVKMDGEILEIETDKVNQALYAPLAGIVHLTIQPGQTVQVGQVVGTIEPSSTPEPKETMPEKTPPVQAVQPEKISPVVKKEPVPSPVQMKPSCSLRYTKEQFLNDLQPLTRAVESPKRETLSTLTHLERETRRPLSKVRQVIAKRLVEAQQTMAMLTTFNEIDLTAVMQLREKYKEQFVKKYETKLGFMSFFVKATVAALELFPDLNSSIEGNEVVQRNYYDIGIAVGTDRGLVVPVIRNCDQLSFSEIEKEIEQYAKKAKEGTLALPDLQGGGFTITNGGTYGSLLSTPIINPPQCAILGMHKIEKRPVVIDDQIVIRSMMYVALSYDHRLIDGKEAVLFLTTIKSLLEDPTRLLLEI
jgi:2-oxoglutarate dehydrogenase E2 component (dihydrolipoamide succinyltransferase)